jgi:hypothetical protein
VETFIRTEPFRFAENARYKRDLRRSSRLLRSCACGMIAATALAKSDNQEQ